MSAIAGGGGKGGDARERRERKTRKGGKPGFDECRGREGEKTDDEHSEEDIPRRLEGAVHGPLEVALEEPVRKGERGSDGDGPVGEDCAWARAGGVLAAVRERRDGTKEGRRTVGAVGDFGREGGVAPEELAEEGGDGTAAAVRKERRVSIVAREERNGKGRKRLTNVNHCNNDERGSATAQSSAAEREGRERRTCLSLLNTISEHPNAYFCQRFNSSSHVNETPSSYPQSAYVA